MASYYGYMHHVYMHHGNMHHGNMNHGYIHHGYMYHGYMHHGHMHDASWTHLCGSHGLSARRARRTKSSRPEGPQTRSYGPTGP